MAANVTFKLALYSSNLQTDVLDLSVTNTLSSATQGGFLRKDIVPTASTGLLIADEDGYADTSKLYLYNASTNSGTNSLIYVSFDAGATVHMRISAGEWALIPWTASGCPQAADRLDLHVWSQTANNTLEYGVFDL